MAGNDGFTKFLLHFNGSTTDSNVGGSAHTWTASGGAASTATDPKFGSGSFEFVGGGSRVITPDHTDFTLGSGDWTFDCWLQTTTAERNLAGQSPDFGSITNVSLDIIVAAGGSVSASANVGSTGFIVNGAISVVDGNWHHLAFVRTGGTLKLFIDGVQTGGNVAISGTVNNSTASWGIGTQGDLDNSFPSFVGKVDEARLSVGIAWWTSNFTPPTEEYSLDASIAAAKGTYTLSGKALTLNKSRVVAVTTGTYAISGKPVIFTYAPIIPPQVLGGGFFPWGSAPWGGTLTLAGFFVVSAEKGTYVVSGQQATLRLDNVIVAEKGTYTLSGKAALVRKTRILVASAGAYSVAGKPVTFLFSKVLRANAGAYNVVGKAAVLDYVPVGSFTLPAAPGTYAVAGQAASLIKARILVAAPGAYSVVGKAAALLHAKLLTAAAGAYAVVGKDATIVKGRTLAAAPGTYAVNGQAAALVKTRILQAAAGAYNVVGKDVSLNYQPAGTFVLPAFPGTYNVSGKAAGLVRGLRFLRADKGTYLISGKAAGLNFAPISPPPERVYTPGWEWQAYDRAWDERRLV